MVVGVARTCRNQESLLWQWEGNNLVNQQAATVAVKRIKDGNVKGCKTRNNSCSSVSRHPIGG